MDRKWLTSYKETEVFLLPVSHFSQAEGDSQSTTVHWVLAPWGSLVPGDGVWVREGERARLDDCRVDATFRLVSNS